MTAISLQPVDAVDAFRRVETEAGLAPRLTDQQLAALALTSFGSLVICSCLPLAVYLLLHQFVSSRDAWRSAALAAVIPCIDLFQPRSDVLYPVHSILLLALLIGSLLHLALEILELAGQLLFFLIGEFSGCQLFLESLKFLECLFCIPLPQGFRDSIGGPLLEILQPLQLPLQLFGAAH